MDARSIECIGNAISNEAAATELDARTQAMANRAEAGVEHAVVGAATALNHCDTYYAHLRADGTRAERLVHKRFDDEVELVDANAKQLRAVAALLCVFPRELALAPLLCGVIVALADPPLTSFGDAATCGASWDVTVVAPTDCNVDVTSLHALATRDVEPLLCELSGAGLNTYDTFIREHNMFRIVAHDVDGAVAEWVTPADILVKLSCETGETGGPPLLSLSYELVSNYFGRGWHVTYVVDGLGVSLNEPGVALEFSLKIEIGCILVWQGIVRVWIIMWRLCVMALTAQVCRYTFWENCIH